MVIINKNKKAAIGALMTWIVATMIILFIVILFIYSSFILSKTKKITDLEFSILETESAPSMASEQMLIALLRTKINERDVEDYIVKGDYGEIRSSVENILEKLPDLKTKHKGAFVYVGDKMVTLNGNSLEVKNRK